MARAVFFEAFDFSNANEQAFHDWYDRERVIAWQRIPGILAVERWIGHENPKIAAATYEIESAEILSADDCRALADPDSPAMRSAPAGLKPVLRYEGKLVDPKDAAAPTGAGGLSVAAMNVDPAAEDDFNNWYDTEHLPLLAAVPGVILARRFRAMGGNGRKTLALYHLTEPEIPYSEAWKNTNKTAWTDRMRANFRDPLVIRLRPYTPVA